MQNLFPIALAAALTFPAGAATPPDTLRPLLDCRYREGFAAVNSERLPTTVKERQVNTELGPRKVSLADGYQTVLAYPSASFFANLRIERSQAERYAADKDAVVSSLRRLAFADPYNPLKLSNEERGGLQIHGLNQTDFSAAGPVAVYSLFDDKRQIITTVFFLNQKPGGRGFRNPQQFQEQRDRMLEDYVACVAKLK